MLASIFTLTGPDRARALGSINGRTAALVARMRYAQRSHQRTSASDADVGERQNDYLARRAHPWPIPAYRHPPNRIFPRPANHPPSPCRVMFRPDQALNRCPIPPQVIRPDQPFCPVIRWDPARSCRPRHLFDVTAVKFRLAIIRLSRNSKLSRLFCRDGTLSIHPGYHGDRSCWPSCCGSCAAPGQLRAI